MNERADAEGITSPSIRFIYRLEDDYNLDPEERRYVLELIDSLKDSDEHTANNTLLVGLYRRFSWDVYEEALAEWRRNRWAELQWKARVAQAIAQQKRKNGGSSWRDYIICSTRTYVGYPLFLIFSILHCGVFGGIVGTISLFIVRRFFRYLKPLDKPFFECGAMLIALWLLEFAIFVIMCLFMVHGFRNNALPIQRLDV